jgi:hypothetical protein
LCPQESTWELEVGIDEDHPLYAEIVERGDEYFVQRMSRDADPECPMSEDATDFEVKEPEKVP